MGCEECIEFKRRQGLKPDCTECKKDKIDLLPENNIIDYIMSKYGSMLVDGMGCINPDGIRFVLELEEIKDKELITQKLITYLRVALDTRSKGDTDGRKDNKN